MNAKTVKAIPSGATSQSPFDSPFEKSTSPKDKPTPLFSVVTDELKIKFSHTENAYDDYAKEVLLPHKMSNFGPGLAVGDVNGDNI